MKKVKKKRTPKHSFSGSDPLLELEIVIVDDGNRSQNMIVVSNRGLKMLKEGRILDRNYLAGGKFNHTLVMHRDVYDREFKSKVDQRRRYQAEKKRQAAEAKKVEEGTGLSSPVLDPEPNLGEPLPPITPFGKPLYAQRASPLNEPVQTVEVETASTENALP